MEKSLLTELKAKGYEQSETVRIDILDGSYHGVQEGGRDIQMRRTRANENQLVVFNFKEDGSVVKFGWLSLENGVFVTSKRNGVNTVWHFAPDSEENAEGGDFKNSKRYCLLQWLPPASPTTTLRVRPIPLRAIDLKQPGGGYPSQEPVSIIYSSTFFLTLKLAVNIGVLCGLDLPCPCQALVALVTSDRALGQYRERPKEHL